MLNNASGQGVGKNGSFLQRCRGWARNGVNAFVMRSAPVSIVHFVTERCNARCDHCFVDFANACPQEQELTLEEIRMMARTMGSVLYNVNLTGGEPFLRSDLFEIAAAYLENTTARSIIITTNGTQIDAIRTFLDRWAEAALPGKIKISISIDHQEDRHDENRGVPGAFRRVLETYTMIEERNDDRLMPDIALTVTPQNADAVLGVHRDLKARGVRHFSAILLRQEGAVQAITGRQAMIAAYVELSRRISSDRFSAQVPLRHRFWERVRDGKNAAVRGLLESATPLVRSRKDCRAGNLFGVICANGDVVPCEVIGRPGRFGNLRDAGLDFLSLWTNGGKMARSRRHDRVCGQCTYECAWTVTILTTPSYYPRMLRHAWRQV